MKTINHPIIVFENLDVDSEDGDKTWHIILIYITVFPNFAYIQPFSAGRFKFFSCLVLIKFYL